MIPMRLASETFGLLFRVEKKSGGKSVKYLLCIPQVSYPVYSALQSPLFVVQQCLLR